MITRRAILRNALSGMGTMLLWPLVGRAGPWPEQTIEIVVGRKAGGGADSTARLLAPVLEERLGASRISVTNMPGASGAVAARFVRSLPPDGHRWLMAGGYHQGLRAMGFDDAAPYRDWQYFGADTSIMSLAVRPDSPIRDLEDLLRRGKDEPDRLRVAVDGIGGTWHLGALLVMRATGARYRIIPYGAASPRRSQVCRVKPTWCAAESTSRSDRSRRACCAAWEPALRSPSSCRASACQRS